MPDSLLGVGLLLAALGPGYIFTVQRQRRVPDVRISDIRELVELALVGALCTLAATLPVTAIATIFGWWPTEADLEQVEASLSTFALTTPTRFVALLAGIVALLALACAFAYGLAVVLYQAHSPSIDPRGSGWRNALSSQISKDKVVTVLLDDDEETQIVGYAAGYTVGPDDEHPRELLLRDPIRLARGKDADLTTVRAERLVIRADQIKFLTVQYKDRPSDSEDEPDEPPSTP